MLPHDTAADTEVLIDEACRLIKATLERNHVV
jgi:hypothetical protein